MTNNSEETLRQQLTDISLRTYRQGLARGSGGNISARLDDGRILITPSGLALDDTTPENIVCVHLQTGEWEAAEPYIPSKETGFHSEIYAARPDVGAIVHCHAPYATSYAVRRMDIPYVTDAAFKQPPVVHVPYAPSGTQELAQNVGQAARSRADFRVMLLDEHGVIAVGADLMEAFLFADLAEEIAQIAWISSHIKSE
ncbi:MAG: class II aldolase/adducin family protein [Chloroflexota bacterium]